MQAATLRSWKGGLGTLSLAALLAVGGIFALPAQSNAQGFSLYVGNGYGVPGYGGYGAYGPMGAYGYGYGGYGPGLYSSRFDSVYYRNAYRVPAAYPYPYPAYRPVYVSPYPAGYYRGHRGHRHCD